MKKVFKIFTGLGLFTYQIQSFAVDWMIKVKDAEDLIQGNKTSIDVAMEYCKKGMSILLFTVSFFVLISFVKTISHGIEEAKKNENVSIMVFSTYSVMATIYLSIGLATGYMGYAILTKFSF